MIPESLKIELTERIRTAHTVREAAVDVLKALQAHYGWLSDEAIAEAARLLGMSPLQVDELATFYEMLYRRPVGRRVVHVCDSISCWSMGAETLMARLCAALGIEPGGTTADNAFTLIPCCCLGNCGEAPTMMVGDAIYGKLTPEKALEILEENRLRVEG